MKTEFSYSHKDGRVMIRAAHMDTEEMAAEVGYLIHNIYSTLMRQSPPHSATLSGLNPGGHGGAWYAHVGCKPCTARKG